MRLFSTHVRALAAGDGESRTVCVETRVSSQRRCRETSVSPGTPEEKVPETGWIYFTCSSATERFGEGEGLLEGDWMKAPSHSSRRIRFFTASLAE